MSVNSVVQVKPEDVDIRLAVGDPVGERPIKLICPLHMERLGVPDDVGSLAVYRSNVHCFGCGYHLRRRFAALAFLLGAWDGKGSEDGERCRSAVRSVKQRLQEFVSAGGGVAPQAYTPPPPDPIMVEAFHQFLLTPASQGGMEDRLVDALMTERGLSLATIREYRLGHTGTHFTIPVPSLDGGWLTVRYRADEQLVDVHDTAYRKYEGTWGHNSPVLYPLHILRGLSYVQELWVVEGEFDAISGNQAGDVTLTVTNGAGSIDKLPGLLFDLLPPPSLLIGSWVIATDQDPAGEKAAEKLRSVLPGQSVTRARWPWGKDITEFYSRGGSRKKIWYE